MEANDSKTAINKSVVCKELLAELSAALLDATEKAEWAGNEDDCQTWGDANKDIGALTRSIEIIKRRSLNDEFRRTDPPLKP